MNNSMIKKTKTIETIMLFLGCFFLSFLREKKKIIQNIYIFTIKSPKKILKRGQGLKINIRLIDQFK